MSTEVAINHIAIRSIRNMKEDDAGGGNAGGRNELKKLKRKSEESIEIGGKKVKKQWKSKTMRRKKLPKWKKIPKKPRSLDGDNPASETKKVTTTTAPPNGGKRKRRMTESFNAPFNSTQFLMNDHKTEAVRYLDSTLNGSLGGQEEVKVDEDEDSVDITIEERPLRRITRARESSFSIDSDDDYYYSSPEDEEEFMSREFIKDYDNLRNDRLIDMSKSELINEYLQMEDKIEALEKRLSRSNSQQQQDKQDNTDDKNNADTKEAMANTIRQFQKEIQRLESENDQLKRVQAVKISSLEQPSHRIRSAANSCSSCSESDSDSSDSDSESDSCSDSDSENENQETTTTSEIQIQVFDKINIEKQQKLSLRRTAEDEEVEEGDTGYESGHSNKPVTTTNHGGSLEEGIDPNEEKEVIVNNAAINNRAENQNQESNQDYGSDESETCPELISVNCITSTSP